MFSIHVKCVFPILRDKGIIVDQNLKIAAYHKKSEKNEAFWGQPPRGLCVCMRS